MSQPPPTQLLKVGERDKTTGHYLVYLGGRHRIFCDGTTHYQLNDDGTRPDFPFTKCTDWVGECPGRVR